MNILITGATGLIGSALSEHLSNNGHQIRILTRSERNPEKNQFHWNPDNGEIDMDAFEGIAGIINLAGTNIAEHRWTPEVKQQILESRIKSTNLICDAISKLQIKPKVLVNASAIGYYGDRGDEILNEKSSPGDGFLADVCVRWEQASKSAISNGVRVVLCRIGLVLTPRGGLLKKVLPIFKFGLGGKLGSGKQYWSWVSLDDLVTSFEFCLTNEEISGPVNIVSPEPLNNREFTKILGRVTKRPAVLTVPRPVLRLTLGEMGDSLIFSSQRVLPTKLGDAGFTFSHPDLKLTLESILKCV